jgi:dihydrofolate reductase
LSKLRFKISMSLDGFVAGPGQSVDNPLGIGGMRLHEWVFPLTVWRAMHGLQGGEVNESTKVVLTHHAREPLQLEGGTTFTFVTDGIEPALEQARRAAAGKDVSLAGGAKAAQQYLAGGLVDEMEINLVPTLLGSGERLFEGVGDDLHGLELIRTVAAPKVTHLKFARRSTNGA